MIVGYNELGALLRRGSQLTAIFLKWNGLNPTHNHGANYKAEFFSRSYPVLLKLVGNLERLGGSDHGLHGGEDVLVDEADEAPLVFV